MDCGLWAHHEKIWQAASVASNFQPMCRLFALILLLTYHTAKVAGWSIGSLLPPEAWISKQKPQRDRVTISRRCLWQTVAFVSTACTTASVWATDEQLTTTAASETARPATIVSLSDVKITLTQPNTRLGIELMDVTIGTPPRTVAAIRAIPFATRTTASLSAGMILRDYDSAAAVTERLRNGPYPVTLVFANLARGGDAIGDTETPLVTAQDALTLAQQTSSEVQTVRGNEANFAVTTVRQKPTMCGIQSRRGDVLEIVYEARVLRGTTDTTGGASFYVYDSSAQRGTGMPYLMVLGSGDVLPGVDLGIYDMCPGEERSIVIPPRLAYGNKGNRLFDIPPNASLEWKVTLVSINSVGDNDTRSRLEIEGRN